MANPCDQLEAYGNATSSCFGTGLLSLIASAALAVSTVISAENAVVNEAATATSQLIAPIENDLTATGAATSALLDTLRAIDTEDSTALARSFVYVSADALVVSTGNASSLITSGKDSTALTSGSATSSVLSGALRAPALAVAQGQASSVVLAPPENVVQSSGSGTSSLTATLRAGAFYTSSGVAVSLLLDNYASAVDALTQASAASYVFDALAAQVWVPEAAQAVSTLLVPASSRAWAANLETHAMWRYKDFAPRWLASINGVTVALTDDGLCEVSQSNSVQWYIETGWSDFGEQHKKRVLYTYVGGEYPAATKLEVGVDMAPAFIGYALTGKRATIGKGLNARYWRFRVSGTGAGSLLDIRSDLAPSARRI